MSLRVRCSMPLPGNCELPSSSLPGLLCVYELNMAEQAREDPPCGSAICMRRRPRLLLFIVLCAAVQYGELDPFI